MQDGYGRKTEYLRLSVTERCQLSCIYCKGDSPEECAKLELSAGELDTIMRAAFNLGLRKLRITGGEPLMRRDLEDIISRASKIGFDEIAMTTNAQGFFKRAAWLKKAGLQRINISVDSLNEEKYGNITQYGELTNVFSAIEAAFSLSLLPVKLNVVVMRGINDNEISQFAELAKYREIDVRFIELMPIGPLSSRTDLCVSKNEILKKLPELKRIPSRYAASPSADYTADGYLGRIGIISPMSCSFCEKCNRIRVTSGGALLPCLGQEISFDLASEIPRGINAVQDAMQRAILAKPSGHNLCKLPRASKLMYKIGG